MTALASLRHRVASSLAPATQRWQTLEVRRQRAITVIAILVFASLVLAYVWLPAMRERERLLERLPQLSAQLAKMQQHADEVRKLSANPPPATSAAPMADIAALQTAFGDTARISYDASRAFRIAIPRMAYANWWDRLGDVQARYALRILSLSLKTVAGGNREVAVEMVLADSAQTAASGKPTSP